MVTPSPRGLCGELFRRPQDRPRPVWALHNDKTEVSLIRIALLIRGKGLQEAKIWGFVASFFWCGKLYITGQTNPVCVMRVQATCGGTIWIEKKDLFNQIRNNEIEIFE